MALKVKTFSSGCYRTIMGSCLHSNRPPIVDYRKRWLQRYVMRICYHSIIVRIFTAKYSFSPTLPNNSVNHFASSKKRRIFVLERRLNRPWLKLDVIDEGRKLLKVGNENR